MPNLTKIATGVFLGVAMFASLATTTPNSFISPQTPNRGIVQFLQGADSAGTYKTLYTAGANGSKCNGMYITSNDAATHTITIQLVNSAVKYGGVSINTGTTSPGFLNGAPAINPLLSSNWPGLPVDQYGNPYIQMITGDTLQATFTTAITASPQVINIVATCSDF